MLLGKTSVDGTPVSKLTRGSEKKVRCKCDECGDVRIVLWSNYRRSTERRGSKKTYCKPCVCRMSALKRRGKTAWNKGKKLSPDQRGKNHPSWKGGSYIDAHGYRMVHRHKPNAKSKWEHYVKEHVAVMEKKLGRALTEDEVVHHIDGDKLNNKVQNLYLTKRHASHRSIHQSLQEVGYELVKAKLVKLNRRNGQYYVAHEKLRELLEHPKSPSGHNVGRKSKRDGAKTGRDR